MLRSVALSFCRSRCDRWPWPLFRLLADLLQDESNIRKQLAAKLLQEPADTLEATTKKVRSRFIAELQDMAQSGKLPAGSGLHCVLSLAALKLKLDAGSLESLNSMVKSSMSAANNTNMSLQLLSARVNSRKMLSVMTGGRNRLKDVRPIVEGLASSSVVFQTREDEVLKTDFRYSPPAPKDMPANNLAKHNPALLLSASDKWAIKFNSKLLEAVRGWKKTQESSQSTQTLLPAMLFQIGDDKGTCQAFLLAEICGRFCWTLQLETCLDAANICCHAGAPLCFRSSLAAIAAQHEGVLQGQRCTLSLGTLAQQVPSQPTRVLQFMIAAGVTHVVDLFRTRTRKTGKPKANARLPEALPLANVVANDDGDSDSDVDMEACVQ